MFKTYVVFVQPRTGHLPSVNDMLCTFLAYSREQAEKIQEKYSNDYNFAVIFEGLQDNN